MTTEEKAKFAIWIWIWITYFLVEFLKPQTFNDREGVKDGAKVNNDLTLVVCSEKIGLFVYQHTYR